MGSRGSRPAPFVAAVLLGSVLSLAPAPSAAFGAASRQGHAVSAPGSATIVAADTKHDDKEQRHRGGEKRHRGDEKRWWCMPNPEAVIGPVCVRIEGVLSGLPTD